MYDLYIDPSKLAAGAVCGEREDYVIRGGSLLSVLSRRRDLQKPNSVEVLSAYLGGAARRWGFGATVGRRLGGDGQAFLITHRV